MGYRISLCRMKTKTFPLFGRILLMVFALITILSVTFILIAYLSVVHYYQASTQLLNKDVAGHIAKFTSPFDQEGLNKQKADSVFYQAMVISPSVEVYFLDTTGRVIYFHGAPNEVTQPVISLEAIREYVNRNVRFISRALIPGIRQIRKFFQQPRYRAGQALSVIST